MGLLQGWLDIGAMVILSLLCFIWAGQTSLGFCLLTCTFISLISSGSGRTSNEFQPCSKPCPLCKIGSTCSAPPDVFADYLFDLFFISLIWRCYDFCFAISAYFFSGRKRVFEKFDCVDESLLSIAKAITFRS